MSELGIAAVLDLSQLDKVLEDFSEATGLATVAVDTRGIPVTNTHAFTDFCRQMRSDPLRDLLCHGCDAHGGLQSLIDSAPDIHASANRAFAPLGQSFSRAEVQGFVGRGAPNLISRLAQSRGLPGTGAAFDDLLARFLEIYEQSHGLTALYPGVLTALDDLARTGARLGVCTNKPIGPTRAVLGHFRLGCFAAVVGGDSLPVKNLAMYQIKAQMIFDRAAFK